MNTMIARTVTVILISWGVTTLASQGRVLFEREVDAITREIRGQSKLLSFKSAQPLSELGRSEAYYHLHLKAIELLPDSDAATFLIEGRRSWVLIVPPLAELTSQLSPDQAVEIVNAMSHKGRFVANAGYRFLQTTFEPYNQHGRGALLLGQGIGARGDDARLFNSTLEAIAQFTTSSDVLDKDTDYLWHVYVRGLLGGAHALDRNQTSAFVKNIENAFENLTASQQRFLAAHLSEVHSDRAELFIEKLLRSNDRELAEATVLGLEVSRDPSAPATALRLFKLHEKDEDPTMIEPLIRRITKDAKYSFGVNRDQARLALRRMKAHRNVIVREFHAGSATFPKNLCIDLFR